MIHPAVRSTSSFTARWAVAAVVGLVPQSSSWGGLLDGADLVLGQRLIAEHRCSACHARRVGGDGSAIYQPGRRLTTTAQLRGMVEQCNTELGLQLFPEEVSAVAAVLQRDHYRLPEP